MKFSILPNPQFLGKFHFLYSVARNLAHTCGKVILYGKLHFFVQWVLSTFTATFSLLNHLSTVLHSMWKPVIWSTTQIQMPYLQIFKNSHVVHNFIQQWCKDLNELIFVKTYKKRWKKSLIKFQLLSTTIWFLDLTPLPSYLAWIGISVKKDLFFTMSY